MLTKPSLRVVTPGVAGSPAVAERIVCPPQPPDSTPKPAGNGPGSYITLCNTPLIEISPGKFITGVSTCYRVFVPSDG